MRLRRLSQPSIHLPFSSYLPGMKTGGAGSISRALSAKKSSVANTTSEPSRGCAKSTQIFDISLMTALYQIAQPQPGDFVNLRQGGGEFGVRVVGDAAAELVQDLATR